MGIDSQKARRDRRTLRDLGMTAELEASVEAAGFVIVPKEPTSDMIEEAYWSAYYGKAEAVWRDMLQAWGKSNSGNSGSDNG